MQQSLKTKYASLGNNVLVKTLGSGYNSKYHFLSPSSSYLLPF